MSTTRKLALATGALLLAGGACVVPDTPPVNSGYGYGYETRYSATATVGVGQPASHTVRSPPPEPLYERMSAPPASGLVWIDGSWHWNGFEWVWLGGRWERAQSAQLVYVQPIYDYAGGRYVYTPGHWTPRDRIPPDWRIHDRRDGRPALVEPPIYDALRPIPSPRLPGQGPAGQPPPPTSTPATTPTPDVREPARPALRPPAT